MANNWKIDPTHSEIQFKVKHLMITTVTGNFNEFDGSAITEAEDFSAGSQSEFTATISSISTNNEQRDEHLKSADFFDAVQFPTLSFKSTKTEGSGDDMKIYGDLTLKGVTKPVVLNAEFGGIVVDPYGQTKAGFTISGKISRKEFGLTWSAITEAGSIVVSDDIRLLAEVQFVKQA
ncbi:YceI family protein [Arcticibacter eurypsychrophilus]|uniref:YceI family protein n=1 Tax=Arcticibacter eurypsychrophilus TaxID=1434752 RepID=UPI00084D8BBF|nr:YceI family protein [Arcticibacter eurypsychrophilus]